MQSKERYELIENYGIVGNLHTVALISKKGSIDFLCYRRFDSPTIFGALLDVDKGGRFSICPSMNHVTYKQLYLPDTAVLVTRFFSDMGMAEIIDFMPILEDEKNFSLIRKITSIKGDISYAMNLSPRFDYARAEHKVEPSEDGYLIEADDFQHSKLRLTSNIKMEHTKGDVHAEFTLKESESAYFILESQENYQLHASRTEQFVIDSYQETIRYWQNWIEASTYSGRWIEMVNRSAITLKLLTSHSHSSMVAAATFGLPEAIPGERNWDYRYTWIRDASLTVNIFLKLGLKKEAASYLSWVEKRCEEGEMQLVYAVDGSTDLEEYILDEWEGYRGTGPVRIGNQASKQFQLDIYGELVDTVYLFIQRGGTITYDFWKIIVKELDLVIKRWKEPDHGIWEIRTERRKYLYSRLMCWVALDRALKIAEASSFPYPEEHWRDIRDQIFHSIYNEFWNEDIQSFVQYEATDAIDASVMMMPLKKFISPMESKWVQTMKAIDKQLRSDVLIYRYNNRLKDIDGLKGEEGTFSMCSFWYVQCLAMAGQVERAREYFEKMLGYTNHLGLFAEEISWRGEQLGNYPQALTHLSLIDTAIMLNDYLEKIG